MTMFKLFLCGSALFASYSYADLPDYEVHQSAELAKGECADPKMTDEQRSERISRSLADAVKCMGEKWVYGDMNMVKQVSYGTFDIDANISENRVRFTDRQGGLHVFLASPGIPTPSRETLTGEFQGPFRVENGDYVVQNQDKDYVGAPMPFAIFYAKNRGYAVHGAPGREANELGRPASHGCIRVAVANAQFMNQQLRMGNDSEARIHVYGQAVMSGGSKRRRREPPPEYDDQQQQPQYSNPDPNGDAIPMGGDDT